MRSMAAKKKACDKPKAVKVSTIVDNVNTYSDACSVLNDERFSTYIHKLRAYQASLVVSDGDVTARLLCDDLIAMHLDRSELLLRLMRCLCLLELPIVVGAVSTQEALDALQSKVDALEECLRCR